MERPEGAHLDLAYRHDALAEDSGRLTMGVALDESQNEDIALLVRQSAEGPSQRLGFLIAGESLVGARLICRCVPKIVDRARRSPADSIMVHHDVASDSDQPVLKRKIPPFETVDPLPRLGEHLRGELFRESAITHLVEHVPIDSVEVLVVELTKSIRVSLRRSARDLPLVRLGHGACSILFLPHR